MIFKKIFNVKPLENDYTKILSFEKIKDWYYIITVFKKVENISQIDFYSYWAKDTFYYNDPSIKFKKYDYINYGNLSQFKVNDNVSSLISSSFIYDRKIVKPYDIGIIQNEIVKNIQTKQVDSVITPYSLFIHPFDDGISVLKNDNMSTKKYINNVLVKTWGPEKLK